MLKVVRTKDSSLPFTGGISTTVSTTGEGPGGVVGEGPGGVVDDDDGELHRARRTSNWSRMRRR